MRTIALLSLLASTSLAAADWPHWRGPDRDGFASEPLPAELPDKLSVLWKAEVGIGFSSFSAVGDHVFTMGNQDEKDTVWCLDAATGEVVWRHDYDCALDPLYYEGGPGATPAVHGDSVFTLSKKGHAFRLDRETGEVIWSRDLLADHGLELPEWSFAGSAYVTDDRVFLNAGRGGIALSRETGETLWLPSTETSGYATPVPLGESLLLFSAEDLIALDPADGAAFWKFPWKSSRDVNAADPLIAPGGIVVSSSSGSKKLDPSGGGEPTVLWEQPDLKWYFNSGVLIDGHLYSLHGTTHRPTELTCTDLATGKTVWAEEGFGSGGLVAAGKDVIVFDLGTLTIFEASPEGFSPKLQQKVLEGKCWTAPIVAHGRIFVRNAEGDVAALAVE